MKVFFGLGNPDLRYVYSRHNLGFQVIDRLGYRNNINIRKRGFDSLIGEGTIGNSQVRLVKPQTYMNFSGGAVRQIVDYLKLGIDEVMVIVDDTNLSLGMVRIRREGEDGGHNGLLSIIEHLKTQVFPRIRIGIGPPLDTEDLTDFVLSSFREEEEPVVEKAIETASCACEVWVKEGIAAAMDRFNRKENEEV